MKKSLKTKAISYVAGHLKQQKIIVKLHL